jgi:orotate phosphoribosyltransferase-like protein
MASKNKINKTDLQKYASLWLKQSGLNETEISDRLGVDIDTIMLWMRENNLANKKPKKSLFINETVGKKNKTVSIMTKEASEKGDEQKRYNQTPRNMDKNIFRPNG